MWVIGLAEAMPFRDLPAHVAGVIQSNTGNSPLRRKKRASGRDDTVWGKERHHTMIETLYFPGALSAVMRDCASRYVDMGSM